MNLEWVTLGECCYSIQDGDWIETKDQSESGYRLLQISNIGLGTFKETKNFRWVSPETFKRLRCNEINIGDVLVARMPEPTGRCWYVDNLPWSAITAVDVAIIRTNPEILDAMYCSYFLNSPQTLSTVASLTVGTTRTRIKRTDLASLELNLPSIKIQKRIANLLRTLDDRITLLRETNATLEAIAQALFKSWFVDFDPVHAKMQGTQPEGMDEQTAALFPDSFEESELGLVPAGWNYVSLREVVSIFDSQRVPLAGQERAKRRGEYPYYGAAALMDCVDDYIFDGVFLLTGEDGSVADSNGYPITQYVWGKIWVNNHAHVLQGKDGVSTEHLMMFLKRTNIEPFITGAVQAKLSQSNMWRIMFLKPPLQISESFGCAIEPLFAKLRHNKEQAQTLADLRDTLLPRLISGQLRVGEVNEH